MKLLAAATTPTRTPIAGQALSRCLVKVISPYYYPANRAWLLVRNDPTAVVRSPAIRSRNSSAAPSKTCAAPRRRRRRRPYRPAPRAVRRRFGRSARSRSTGRRSLRGSGRNRHTVLSEVDTAQAPCACSQLGKMYQRSQPYAPPNSAPPGTGLDAGCAAQPIQGGGGMSHFLGFAPLWRRWHVSQYSVLHNVNSNRFGGTKVTAGGVMLSDGGSMGAKANSNLTFRPAQRAWNRVRPTPPPRRLVAMRHPHPDPA